MERSANKYQRIMPKPPGLKRPAANAFIPLLLIRNGQALVKAVPYSILQRAMGRMQQSKRRTDSHEPGTPGIPQRNGQQASSFYSSNKTVTVKPHDFGLSITDVKSISMNEYNKIAMKSQEKSPQSDTEKRQETNSIPDAGPLGSDADHCRKLKMKFSRQRCADPSATWRVVPYNSEPAVSEKDHQDNKLRGPLDQSSDDFNSEGKLTKEHLTIQSDLNLERKRSAHEFEKTCARCEPFSTQTRAAPCKTPSSSSSATEPSLTSSLHSMENSTYQPHMELSAAAPSLTCSLHSVDNSTYPPAMELSATEPSITSSLHSVDNSTYQPELSMPELSMQYDVNNRRKSKGRPDYPTTSLSTGSLPLVSPRGDHSCTDTTSSSGVPPHKRRRVSAASSSGDFHSSLMEAQPDTSDTDSDASSDLDECPPWIYDKPVSKGAIGSVKTTPVTSKGRCREVPSVVFESPRDEMIHNLKRLLEQQTQTLDNLKAPGSR